MFRRLAIIFCALGLASLAYADTFQTPRLKDDGIHDPENDAINILQEPVESMVDFPLDRRGKIDWVQAIRNGKISPRKSLGGDEFGGEMMMEMDLDLLLKQTASMPYVRFPHLAHTEWLACSNCHPDIFEPQLEANDITMEKILKGEFCGRCHDKVAFSLWTCERCHSVPHDQSDAAYIDLNK